MMSKISPMPIQDDSRENQMIDMFNLSVPQGRGRADIDAHLNIDGQDIPFELKSSTRLSVVTARDFGMGHICKWRRDNIHWLYGFYLSTEEKPDYCIYCSPDDMEGWYSDMENYIKPDLILGEYLPGCVDEKLVRRILGKKPKYSYSDAYRIMKRQFSAQEYRDYMDLEDGYSIKRMKVILQLRAKYVIERGSTLNNPHLSPKFFEDKPHIVEDPAIRLRDLVHNYLLSLKNARD